ncbi:MAG: hypothetical protein M1357_02820 [Candidatus Marsarchaeota archaeon]|nr:hypothetical protein [Candidatus Marsarchaeota archaeon]
MTLQATVLGGSPHGVLMKYRQMMHEGKISEEKYLAKLEAQTGKFIRFQLRLGVNPVSDGLLEWDDLFAPYCRGALAGAERGSLIRFFDNNVYYRRPVITAKLRLNSPVSSSTLMRALNYAAPGRFKGFIPGPETFVRLSEDKYYQSADAFVLDVAQVLREDLSYLIGKGVGAVEVFDPSLSYASSERLTLLKPIYQDFIRGFEDKTWIALPYFWPRREVIDWLADVGLTTVCPDFSPTTFHSGDNVNDFLGTLAALKRWLSELSPLTRQMGFILGLTDSRNTLVEQASYIRDAVDAAVETGAKVRGVSNNGTLDLLPESVAFKKIRVLAKAAKSWSGGER